MDILCRNNKVCFEFDLVEGLIESDEGCKCDIRCQSVIGSGIAHLVDGADEKQRALALIMAQYTERTFACPDAAVERTAVIKLEIESLTGKQSKR